MVPNVKFMVIGGAALTMIGLITHSPMVQGAAIAINLCNLVVLIKWRKG